MIKQVVFILTFCFLCQIPFKSSGQETAFTYQGRLTAGGNSVSGNYDIEFTLYGTNISGGALAGPVTNTAVGVSNGLFTTAVDFGVFPGTGGSWLEIAVRTNGSGPFSTLVPRQQLTAVPFAVTAENINGTVPAGSISGQLPLAAVPPTVVTNGESGLNLNGTFGGNGAALTNLNASNLTAGTIPLTAENPSVLQAASVSPLTVLENLQISGTKTVQVQRQVEVAINYGAGTNGIIREFNFVIGYPPATLTNVYLVIATGIGGGQNPDDTGILPTNNINVFMPLSTLLGVRYAPNDFNFRYNTRYISGFYSATNGGGSAIIHLAMDVIFTNGLFMGLWDFGQSATAGGYCSALGEITTNPLTQPFTNMRLCSSLGSSWGLLNGQTNEIVNLPGGSGQLIGIFVSCDGTGSSPVGGIGWMEDAIAGFQNGSTVPTWYYSGFEDMFMNGFYGAYGVNSGYTFGTTIDSSPGSSVSQFEAYRQFESDAPAWTNGFVLLHRPSTTFYWPLAGGAVTEPGYGGTVNLDEAALFYSTVPPSTNHLGLLSGGSAQIHTTTYTWTHTP